MSLVETINALSLRRCGRIPDWKNPTGYNDLIHWLKVHDQRPEHIIACDKVAVREMVWAQAGSSVLIPASIGWPPAILPGVVKCSHDSGSAVVIGEPADIAPALQRLNARLAKPYGAEKGEWAYQFVEPRIIAERLLAGQIIDYKFHCAHGQVRWVQVIWDRASAKPREAIFTPDGKLTTLHMDDKMRHAPDASKHPGPEAWEALTELALKLAAGWRYVRVDLYWCEARPWFGELTFWPKAGCYRTRDEPTFGKMLGLDLSERREPIIC